MAFGKMGARGGFGSLGLLGGAQVYTAAANTLFAAMTTPPTAARKALINNLIVSLQAAGVWSKLDIFYMMAAADSQAARLNWKNPGTYTLTPSNSPVFTADQGYKGDGAASFLTASGYNASTAGLNYALNSAALGLYVRQASTLGSAIDLYMTNARLQANSTSTAYQTRINDSTALSYTYGTKTGHFSGRRTAAGARQFLLSGAQVNSDATASTSIATNFVLLGTGATSFSDAQLSVAYDGAGTLTDQNIVDLTTALTTYLTAIGAV